MSRNERCEECNVSCSRSTGFDCHVIRVLKLSFSAMLTPSAVIWNPRSERVGPLLCESEQAFSTPKDFHSVSVIKRWALTSKEPFFGEMKWQSYLINIISSFTACNNTHVRERITNVDPVGLVCILFVCSLIHGKHKCK